MVVLVARMKWKVCLAILGAFLFSNLRAAEKPYTTWREYGGSIDSMQYSALSQINKTNVAKLKPVWFFHVGGEPVHLPFNPLVIEKVMYVSGPRAEVVALDALTGKQLWVST